MSVEDTPHYGVLLAERRKMRNMSVVNLANLAKMKPKRILEIEQSGIATLEEKDRLLKSMLRFSILTGFSASTEAISEQVVILHALTHSFVLRLKNRLPAEITRELEDLLGELLVEAKYHAILLSRAGLEEEVLEQVRARRDPEQ